MIQSLWIIPNIGEKHIFGSMYISVENKNRITSLEFRFLTIDTLIKN